MFITILKIVLGLMGLTLVVTVHELGHYVAARIFGLDVLTFSVGMGKKLITLKKWGTEWVVSLLPIGGYCRIKGEQNFLQALEEKADHISYEKGTLFSAPWWQRIIVALAGPAANLLFAALILSGVALIRYPQPYNEPVVVPISYFGEQDKVWPADKAGLQKGDRILQIGDAEITRFEDIPQSLLFKAGQEIPFTIERGNEQIILTVIPELNTQNGMSYLGVYPWVSPIVQQIPTDSPMDFLEVGDLILEINGNEIFSTMELFQVLEDSEYSISTVKLTRQEREISFSPQIVLADNTPFLGFNLEELSPRKNIFTALFQGFKEMTHSFSLTAKSLTLLFNGVEVRSAISGPIKISLMTGEVALSGFTLGFRQGLYQIVSFLSFICVALAFMNLLPIPILDGGQIILYLIDGVKRKPIKPSFIYYYQLVGTIMVIALAIFATGNDLTNL